MLVRRDRERTDTGALTQTCVWRHARKFLAMAVVAVMVTGSFIVKVEAAAGDLDTTFSGDGRHNTDFLTGDDSASAVAVQADGKIVVAGTAHENSGFGYDFALARYNANGALDTTFSTDGKLTTDFPGFNSAGHDVAIQADGKIVVVGFTQSSINDYALARYNTNGTLDTTFSTDGKQTTDFSGQSDVATSIVIQPNGKIVVIGYVFNAVTHNHDFGLARYNTNGTLDTTFSTDGKQTTDFSATRDVPLAIALQSNGKMVLAGSISTDTVAKFALARYNGNGTLDTTFSGDGKLTTDFVGNSVATAVAIQSDGKIVTAGVVYDTSTTTKFALARYNGNGSLDSGLATDTTPGDSFGTGGKVTTDFFGDENGANAVVIQTNGKIVAAGMTTRPNGDEDFALARYNTDGTLDMTFSMDGKQNTDFRGVAPSSQDSAYALALQTDGKIVAAGTVRIGRGKTNFGLARYLVN